MTELSGLLELIKPFGASALIFAIWYLYHKSVVEQYKTLVTENFKLLNGMIENALLQNVQIQELKDLITNNRWCPYMEYLKRKEGGIDD